VLWCCCSTAHYMQHKGHSYTTLAPTYILDATQGHSNSITRYSQHIAIDSLTLLLPDFLHASTHFDRHFAVVTLCTSGTRRTNNGIRSTILHAACIAMLYWDTCSACGCMLQRLVTLMTVSAYSYSWPYGFACAQANHCTV
jgi:hypothetical protein